MKRIGVAGIPGAWSTEQLLDAVEAKTGFRLLIDMSKVRLDLDSCRVFQGETDLTELDAIIVKKIAPSYSPDALDRMAVLGFLHARGTPVFSNPFSMIQLIDRLTCTLRLRAGGFPMPPTVITEDVAEAAATVERYSRAVFKPLYSSKARGMQLIGAGPDALQKIEAFQNEGNPVMYIQQMVTHQGKDLGITFLGGKYLATYARKGSGESWDTTTRTGGRYVPYDPSPAIIDLAHRAQALFPGMAFTCVDVVETPDGPFLYEVSAFGGFRGLLDANGINMAELYVSHVLEIIE
jgi:tetrahydromethanopterin:alpha-L-glutamate ligase